MNLSAKHERGERPVKGNGTEKVYNQGTVYYHGMEDNHGKANDHGKADDMGRGKGGGMGYGKPEFFCLASRVMDKSAKDGRLKCSLKTQVNRLTALNRLKEFLLEQRKGNSTPCANQPAPRVLPTGLAGSMTLGGVSEFRRGGCIAGGGIGEGRVVLPLTAFTPALMARFERHLLDSGVNVNTAAAYMRSLRSLYNLVVAEVGARSRQPFRQVRTCNAPCSKDMTLTEEEMVAVSLWQSSSGQGWEQLAHDLFMLSFYCCGMPPIDLLHLRRSQIDLEQGRLTYRRQKTGRPGQVELGREAMKLLLPYLSPGMRADDYVFPVLVKGESVEADYRRYCHAMSAVNRALHRIGQRLGLPIVLTFYVARHSWANIIHYNYGASMGVASLGLCHASEKTTQLYLSRPDRSLLRSHQSKLLVGFAKKQRAAQKSHTSSHKALPWVRGIVPKSAPQGQQPYQVNYAFALTGRTKWFRC